MLSKLIKYNLRSTWRDFAGIYMAILLGVIVVPLMLNNINNKIANMSAGFIAVSIVIAVIVIMITNLFKIFNVNVFSKEGYLTMTLPVTSTQIVSSKLIVSSMWIVLTGIVSVIGMLIFAMIISPISPLQLSAALNKILSHLNIQSTFSIILLTATGILSAMKEVSKLFLACTIAHLKQLNKFRVPVGIASYFVFSWIETLIVQIILIICGLIFSNFGDIMIKIENMSDPALMGEFYYLFNIVIGCGILYSIFLAVVYSAGTIWLMNHKLDLD